MKRIGFVFLSVFLMLALTGMAFAACPSLVGKWKITIQESGWEEGTFKLYTKGTATMNVIHQQSGGCLFRGYVVGQDEGHTFKDPFTGAIRGNDVRITFTETIIDGTLTNLNNTVSFLGSSFGPSWIYTFTGSAVRQ